MGRISIPRAVRDKVLNEFNHRCAICGTDKPHIHHIDEDPSNNDHLNLLPLCPNCHITDHHNPTTPIDPRKLSLFRRYKDPVILMPQFDPLFRRVVFLLDLNESTFDVGKTKKDAQELISFVKVLRMGEFYSDQIQKLIWIPSGPLIVTSNTREFMYTKRDKKESNVYSRKLIGNREQVISLIIELLRYQEW